MARTVASVCLLFFFYFLSLASFTDAQCWTTRTKVESLLTKLFASKNIDATIKLLIEKGLAPNLPLNVTCQREYDCWKNGGGNKCIINQLISGVPVTQYMSLLKLYSNFNNCLKKGGTNVDTIIQKVAPALLFRLNSPYQLCRNKYNTMKKNKAAVATIVNQVCATANSGFTKWLIQACITIAKQKVNKWAHWKCIKDAAPVVMKDRAVYNLYTW